MNFDYKFPSNYNIESQILSMMTNSDIMLMLRDKQQELKEEQFENIQKLKGLRGDNRKIQILLNKDFENRIEKEISKWQFILNERTGKASKQIDLDKYKRQIPLIEVMHLFGVKVHSDKRNIKCPFPNHKDGTPSFKVYGNNFHCFGCHTSGTQIDFIKEMTNCELKDAIRKFIEIGKNYVI